jgi:hypothetical protein
MKSIGLRAIFIYVIVLSVTCLCLAQQPRLSNGQLAVRSAAAGLESEFRALVAGQTAPAWIGYSVPMIAGEHNMCCNGNSAAVNCCGTCRLEGKESGNVTTGNPPPVPLEGGKSLFVLFRVEKGQVQKIRSFTEDCQLDAGGLPFHWLTGVRPPDSASLLASMVHISDTEDKAATRLADSALAALAFHDDPSADRAFEQATASNQAEAVRERASFWLGAARSRRGYEILRRMMSDDPSARVREKVVFALSISKEPEAVSIMIEAAKNDKSDRVRGQALFWLGQKAGKRAVSAIADAIENDPETEVKKKAVFALSQLPADEGVPRLIQVARTHKNPAVRKQAMFWLGQSKDPRALSFFEEILTR